ncbi:PssE/Cps14G family polysaccharide biosynthesis glycosyltransferase [Bacillus sp. DX4.1]|uniref:PssE/Cps14G family polysaccharide biosynthesis glycosyltransferase n=1 Tax=Bacillus sp. DX4.1 TaxID=3055867 RepID=UPI0025A2CFE3|nr:PssE/Cps14G family polysaccharide biosynthesis glycosyltransferase [Bacillus sp. DX4.1]MDM5187902.1 PssE/Cps14G family polysaccharide biosynthesis glycosyltransferase [Bacillus sp. DX4.1]
MIFITVGTQKFAFNRLIQALDELALKRKVSEEMFAQIGYSTYIPTHIGVKKMLTPKEFSAYMERASIVITHGGTSSIIQALKQKKKVIVVPRRKKYKEHVDDHQVEIAQMFSESGMVEILKDVSNLLDQLQVVKQKEYKPYIERESGLVQDLALYLERI